jgi:hypothetical protein
MVLPFPLLRLLGHAESAEWLTISRLAPATCSQSGPRAMCAVQGPLEAPKAYPHLFEATPHGKKLC